MFADPSTTHTLESYLGYDSFLAGRGQIERIRANERLDFATLEGLLPVIAGLSVVYLTVDGPEADQSRETGSHAAQEKDARKKVTTIAQRWRLQCCSVHQNGVCAYGVFYNNATKS